MGIVRQLDISLHETEITLHEFNNVISHHKSVFTRAYDEIPDDLVPSTNNVLLQAYRKQKQNQSDLKPEQFLSQFLDFG